MRYAGDALGNNIPFGRRLLLAVMLVSVLFSPHVMALSLAPGPTVAVGVYGLWDNSYYPMFGADPRNNPYRLDAVVDVPGGYLLKGDLYFGLILPGSGRILTLGTDGGSLSLKEGLVPIAQGLDLAHKSTIKVSSILGKDVDVSFTGAEPQGMYLIFAILMIAGTTPDLNNSNGWLDINIKPLVFKP